MTPYMLLGASFAFAAAVQPGPLQAYLVSRSLSSGWRRTLPAAFSPLLSDGPIIVLVLLVLHRIPPWMETGLRGAGGVFLFYLAVIALRTWRHYESPDAQPGSARDSLLRATGVNLLNPGPYLGWTLVMGPLFLEAWGKSPASGIALLAGFYATMVLSLAGTIVLFAAFRSFGARVGRALVAASAVALAAFGCYQVWVCARAILGR